MKRYIVLLASLSIILAIGIVFIRNFISVDLIGTNTWYLLIYFLVVTLAFHYGLVHSSKGRPQVFIRYYMATTTFKLLLHMAVIVIFSLFNKTEAISFITTFLIFYIIFTAFEVGVAWKQFRKG